MVNSNLQTDEFFPCSIFRVAGIDDQVRQLPEGVELGVHQEVKAGIAKLGASPVALA